MIKFDNVSFSYDGTSVLSNFTMEAVQGRHVLVLGPSGSGKSTILNLAAGLISPSLGTVTIADQTITGMNSGKLDQFRGKTIGIIFQQLHLLQTLSVKQNLLAAQYLAGEKQQPERVSAILERLELKGLEQRKPAELSYGQQQRVSIGRALMNKPRVILADEPTSSLDDANAERVVALLKEQANLENATLLIATHDQRVRDHFDNPVEISA